MTLLLLAIPMREDVYQRLQHLAEATSNSSTVEDLLCQLVDSVDQAIHRPGSWERCCFEKVFGDALDDAQAAMARHETLNEPPQMVTRKAKNSSSLKCRH